MKFPYLLVFFALLCSLTSCTVERPEEQIIERHANGVKKTSIWIYPDGDIQKRNEWYNNGIKELEIPYKNGVPHGKFKRWTGFGDVALTGSYNKGLRNGKWTSYYANKKVEAIRFYKEDHPIGDWEGWHHNREKSFEEHYDDNGNPTGVWKKWHDNGVLSEEHTCHKVPAVKNKSGNLDIRTGYYKRFAKNCKILEYFSCTDGLKNGTYKFYYQTFDAPDTTSEKCNQAALREEGISEADSTLYPTANYRADGTFMKKIQFHPTRGIEKIQWFDENNNVIRESVFTTSGKNDSRKKTGISYGTCESSSTLFCAETSYVQSDLPNGILDSSTLSDKDAYKLNIGKNPASLRYTKTGHTLLYEELWAADSSRPDAVPQRLVSRSFYPDSTGGSIATLGYWKNGKRHGIWRNWYANGNLRDSLTFISGERIGDQFSYDSTGKLTIHKTEAGKNRPVIMHLINQ